MISPSVGQYVGSQLRELASCLGWFVFPTNIFSVAATPAHSIRQLSILALSVTGSIFVVVATLFTVAIVRFRARPGQDKREPIQLYGSNQIELSWTVIPIVIVLVLFLATARVILATEKAHAPKDALQVQVIGHQFWWEYRYTGTEVVTANELHIPVVSAGNTGPTYLSMISADTDHSFWVPRLAGKLDVIPNKINVMWFDPHTPDLYVGQCAQFCGTQHAKMLIRVYAQTPEDYRRWLANQALPAPQVADVQDGRAVFEQNACMNCHRIRGTVADGRFGPDLTHFASRDTLAAGTVPNTPPNVAQWIKNPAHYKDGALMPAMHLDDGQIARATAYLETLH